MRYRLARKQTPGAVKVPIFNIPELGRPRVAPPTVPLLVPGRDHYILGWDLVEGKSQDGRPQWSFRIRRHACGESSSPIVEGQDCPLWYQDNPRTGQTGKARANAAAELLVKRTVAWMREQGFKAEKATT